MKLEYIEMDKTYDEYFLNCYTPENTVQRKWIASKVPRKLDIVRNPELSKKDWLIMVSYMNNVKQID